MKPQHHEKTIATSDMKMGVGPGFTSVGPLPILLYLEKFSLQLGLHKITFISHHRYQRHILYLLEYKMTLI